MAISDVRLSVLDIVNEVERLLGVNTSSTLTSTKLTRVLLRFLNEVIEECADAGDWQELYAETTVTMSSSVEEFTVSVSGSILVQRIEEIVYAGVSSRPANSPLFVRSMEDIRRLQRGRSFGEPRQFAIFGVNQSTGNPRFRTSPIPASAQDNATFRIAYREKPILYTTSTAHSSALPVFPGNLLVRGVYAKALLEENGGNPSPEYVEAQRLYLTTRSESLNRFNADTGTDVYLMPE